MVIAKNRQKNRQYVLIVNLDRPKKFVVYEKVYYGMSNEMVYLQCVSTGEYLCKSVARYFTARQIKRARRLAAQETKRWWREAWTPTIGNNPLSTRLQSR